MVSNYEDEEDGGEFPSPPFFASPRGHKPLPFDPSPAREADMRICAEAQRLQPGRESYTIAGCRQIVEIEKRRLTYLDYRERAKRRKAARSAT